MGVHAKPTRESDDISETCLLHRREFSAARTSVRKVFCTGIGKLRKLREGAHADCEATLPRPPSLLCSCLRCSGHLRSKVAFSNPEGRCNSPRCRILHSCPRLPRPKTQTPFAVGPFFFRLRRNPRAHDGDMLKTRLVSAYAERRWRKVICDCFAVEADFARTSFSTAVLHLRRAERAPTWRHW